MRDIYNSTIFSDIVKRNQVRKIDQLERVIKYTFNNVGNTFSAKSISDYLKAEHRALDNETVSSYLETLEKAYLLHRCSRFDLQGKEILKTQEKFYLADTALRYSVLGYNADSVTSSLENVVYLELCRRGYTVNVGKSGSGEIDFVAVRQNEKLYVQKPSDNLVIYGHHMSNGSMFAHLEKIKSNCFILICKSCKWLTTFARLRYTLCFSDKSALWRTSSTKSLGVPKRLITDSVLSPHSYAVSKLSFRSSKTVCLSISGR